MVYWQPPEQALDKVKELVWEPSISRYGADEGIPELRAALIKKVSPCGLTRCIMLFSSLNVNMDSAELGSHAA